MPPQASTIVVAFSTFYQHPLQKQWDTNRPMWSLNPPRWCPPPSGWIKVNVDGALFSNSVGGIGVVIRDADGKLITCAGTCMEHWDAAQTELEALAFIHQCLKPELFDMEGILIEGDCKNVITYFQQCFQHKNWPLQPQLASTIDSLMKLKNVRFHVMNRESHSNRTAHVCAHLSIQCHFFLFGILSHWLRIPS